MPTMEKWSISQGSRQPMISTYADSQRAVGCATGCWRRHTRTYDQKIEDIEYDHGHTLAEIAKNFEAVSGGTYA